VEEAVTAALGTRGLRTATGLAARGLGSEGKLRKGWNLLARQKEDVMLKRFVMIGLLGISMIGMLRTAEAHWVPTLAGWAWHSVRCTVELQQVPKLNAVTECVVTEAIVESLCVNNGGNIQPQGESQAPVQLVGDTASKGFVVKNKNTAIVNVDVGTPDGKPNDPPLDSSFCENPNWTNVANLIRSFHSEINTYKCLDDLCEPPNGRLLVSTVETVEPCMLPAEFNLDGFDIGSDPFEPDEDEVCPNCPTPGTAYVCPNPVSTHVN
jgi:hypothetical protein